MVGTKRSGSYLLVADGRPAAISEVICKFVFATTTTICAAMGLHIGAASAAGTGTPTSTYAVDPDGTHAGTKYKNVSTVGYTGRETLGPNEGFILEKDFRMTTANSAIASFGHSGGMQSLGSASAGSLVVGQFDAASIHSYLHDDLIFYLPVVKKV